MLSKKEVLREEKIDITAIFLLTSKKKGKKKINGEPRERHNTLFFRNGILCKQLQPLCLSVNLIFSHNFFANKHSSCIALF